MISQFHAERIFVFKLRRLGQSNLFWILLPFILGIVSFLGVIWEFWWFRMENPFGDLAGVTSAVQCISDNPNWTLANQSCDPYLRPFNNSTALISVLSDLGVRQIHTMRIGYSFIVLTTFLCFWLSYKIRLSLVEPVIGSSWFLLWLSPSILLLTERGNIDALVATLISIFIFSSRGQLFSIVSLILASFLKFYPMVLWLPVMLSRKIYPIYKIVFSLFLIVFVSVTFREMELVYRHTVQVGGFSFGVRQPFLFLQELMNIDWLPPKIQYSALAPFVVLTGILTFLRFKKIDANVESTNWINLNIDAPSTRAGVVFLAIFLVGNSYDYRLIFLNLFIGSLIVDGYVSKMDKAWYLALALSNLLGFAIFPLNFLFDGLLYVFLARWCSIKLIQIISFARDLPLRRSFRY